MGLIAKLLGGGWQDDNVDDLRASSVAAALSEPGLTLFDKKCILINREFDRQGMGKYQWYIWGLCGFGYMLDLLWAQAFGLVLSPIKQEFGFPADQSGNISVAFSSGLTAGAFVWGFLVDIVGLCTLAYEANLFALR